MCDALIQDVLIKDVQTHVTKATLRTYACEVQSGKHIMQLRADKARLEK
jgi:hypothetical protein